MFVCLFVCFCRQINTCIAQLLKINRCTLIRDLLGDTVIVGKISVMFFTLGMPKCVVFRYISAIFTISVLRRPCQ